MPSSTPFRLPRCALSSVLPRCALLAAGALLSTIAAGASTAVRPAGEPQPLQALLADGGNAVPVIRGIEAVTHWQPIDAQTLTLRVNHAQDYLLTLTDPCLQMRSARLLGLSMSNREVWADFDYVAADGWECRIDSIHKL